MRGISLAFCVSKLNWPEFLEDLGNWAEFLQEVVGLGCLSGEAGSIGLSTGEESFYQHSFSGQDLSTRGMLYSSIFFPFQGYRLYSRRPERYQKIDLFDLLNSTDTAINML